MEDSALADGEEFTNEPGAVIHLKQNRMGGVQRLGGLQSIANGAMGVEFFKTRSSAPAETTTSIRAEKRPRSRRRPALP